MSAAAVDGELAVGDTLNAIDRLVDVIIIFPITFRDDAGHIPDPQRDETIRSKERRENLD